MRKTVAVSNPPRTGSQTHQRTGLAVAGLSLGTALNPLNSSMIAVARPFRPAPDPKLVPGVKRS